MPHKLLALNMIFFIIFVFHASSYIASYGYISHEIPPNSVLKAETVINYSGYYNNGPYQQHINGTLRLVAHAEIIETTLEFTTVGKKGDIGMGVFRWTLTPSDNNITVNKDGIKISGPFPFITPNLIAIRSISLITFDILEFERYKSWSLEDGGKVAMYINWSTLSYRVYIFRNMTWGYALEIFDQDIFGYVHLSTSYRWINHSIFTEEIITDAPTHTRDPHYLLRIRYSDFIEGIKRWIGGYIINSTYITFAETISKLSNTIGTITPNTVEQVYIATMVLNSQIFIAYDTETPSVHKVEEILSRGVANDYERCLVLADVLNSMNITCEVLGIKTSKSAYPCVYIPRYDSFVMPQYGFVPIIYLGRSMNFVSASNISEWLYNLELSDLISNVSYINDLKNKFFITEYTTNGNPIIMRYTGHNIPMMFIIPFIFGIAFTFFILWGFGTRYGGRKGLYTVSKVSGICGVTLCITTAIYALNIQIWNYLPIKLMLVYLASSTIATVTVAVFHTKIILLVCGGKSK